MDLMSYIDKGGAIVYILIALKYNWIYYYFMEIFYTSRKKCNDK